MIFFLKQDQFYFTCAQALMRYHLIHVPTIGIKQAKSIRIDSKELRPVTSCTHRIGPKIKKNINLGSKTVRFALCPLYLSLLDHVTVTPNFTLPILPNPSPPKYKQEVFLPNTRVKEQLYSCFAPSGPPNPSPSTSRSRTGASPTSGLCASSLELGSGRVLLSDLDPVLAWFLD